MNIQSINNYNQNYKYNNFNKLNHKNTEINVPTNTQPTDLAFKGKISDKIGEFFSKYYVEPMLRQGTTRKVSKSLSKKFSNLTAHMATLGSFITSGVYMQRTLTNKDLDTQKRKTLAINQGLCFIIPTFLAYKVNSKLGNYIKKKEYKYSDTQAQKKALGKLTEKQLEEYTSKIGNRLKGFKTLATLATFTLIYRYITPVAITPLANWLGKKMNG